MTNENILKALYENRKLTVAINYRIYGEKSGLSEGYAYAIANDIYPFFHEDEGADPYYDLYKISEKLVSRILTKLDDNWIDGKSPTFYDLEDLLGGKSLRSEIIHSLRYARLSSRFDEDVWLNLLKWAPVEAKSILRPLGEWEL